MKEKIDRYIALAVVVFIILLSFLGMLYPIFDPTFMH